MAVSQKNPKKSDFIHKHTKEFLYNESQSTCPCMKTELAALTQDRPQSCNGFSTDVHWSQAYKRMAPFNQEQRFVGCWTGSRGSPSTITTAFECGPREGVNKKLFCTHGDARILCKEGQLKEGLHILNQPGFRADSKTYISLLQGCIRTKSLAEGRKVHAHIIQSAFKPNNFLLNTLINMYTKCGSMEEARQLFDKMPERDMFTWTMMMGGYAKHGNAEEALKIYDQMQLEGLKPDRVTFTTILNVCACLRALDKGRQVNADICRSNIGSDIILESALVDMYAKCGTIEDARKVFEHMANRNVVSWNAMIGGYAQCGLGEEAFKIYDRMQREGVTPNMVTFICVLNGCASLGDLKKGKHVHADISRSGIVVDVILETALVVMYTKCGSMKDACHTFYNMAKRNVVTWTAMIAGYARLGPCEEAFKLYEQMQQERVTPNTVTFICVLNLCASIGTLEKGKQIHADISKSGIVVDISLENTLVDMYTKCGSIEVACQVFDEMATRNVVSWTAVISGYAQLGHNIEALRMYNRMKQEGVVPDPFTFTTVINVCTNLRALENGKEVHADIRKSGIATDIILENSLVDMYAKCGCIVDAQQVFQDMATRNVVSWNAIIAGYTRCGAGAEALKIYERMQDEGVKANMVTFICVLNACTSLGAVEKGKQVHADISTCGIAPDIVLETTLVNMYAKCGSIEDAQQVFEDMAERDVIAWSAMVAGYGQHGRAREGLQLFERFSQGGLKPNSITFTSVLSACSHAGLVDEGRHYFDSMMQDHGLTPTVEHFGCMVDLLGRAGCLQEAEEFIKKVPFQPGVSAAAWKALLGACRTHGDVKLAEHAAKFLLDLAPEQDTAALVLLLNAYAAACRWKDEG